MEAVRDIIYRFRHFGEDPTGYTTDDTSLSDLAVYKELSTSRAVIIKNTDKKGAFPQEMYVTLPCIQLEEVDANECNLVPPSGCKVLKSTCALPTHLKIRSVTSLLGNTKFNIVPWDSLQAKLDNPIESIARAAYASYRTINGKLWLYILNESNLKVVSTEIIPEDVVEAAQFCGDKESLCNPMDVPWSTAGNLTNAILKLTWDTIMRTRQTARPDILNDDTNIQ
jgi:hypothetical protein